MNGHHEISRGIVERILISGRLELLTPAHFGNGEVRGDALVDMTLLMDEAEMRALIPGTTIAGALRSYLRERLHGYGSKEPDAKNSPIARLFGPLRAGTNATDQSLLIVDDALARIHGTTLRDGVRIESATTTAADKAKFDIELLEAGTAFDLHFEVLVTETSKQALLPFLAAALEGFENGDIRLGARKRRGYGHCSVSNWSVSSYKLTDPQDLCLWLATPSHSHRKNPATGSIATALADTAAVGDNRLRSTLTAQFTLEGSSMLIRSGFGESDVGPDMEQLHATHVDGGRWPVIPGTSWAGVLRHRALRIAKTLASASGADIERAEDLVNTMFGWMPDKENGGGQSSRVTVDETRIFDGVSLYQTRVRIDRATGGAFETALFDQAPLYGKRGSTVDLRLQLHNPERHELGLLLLLLKDLWTGDLTVGGEASVGRGRLKGLSATISMEEPHSLLAGDPLLGLSDEAWSDLQGYVDALWNALAAQGDNVS